MDLYQLIKEAKQGSAAAQRILFDEMAERLLMVCRRYVKNPEDAEEVLLDGFYKFFKNLSSFTYHSDAALYAWVKKIMINESLMFLRKKNGFTMTSESEVEDIPLNEEALNHLSAEEIFNLIIQLPFGYRTVFNLFEIEGFGHKEIALLLNITEGTSKSQLSKSKVLLQKMLSKNGIQYVTRKSQ